MKKAHLIILTILILTNTAQADDWIILYCSGERSVAFKNDTALTPDGVAAFTIDLNREIRRLNTAGDISVSGEYTESGPYYEVRYEYDNGSWAKIKLDRQSMRFDYESITPSTVKEISGTCSKMEPKI